MNRQKADKVLAFAALLFLAAVAVRWLYRDAVWSQALFHMAEAALVGGVADWFAVTALFRRPLGITFHTAIIPRNREKIVNAVSYMVQEEFLSRQSLQRHLRNIRLVSLLIRWMDSGGKQTVLRLLTRAVDAWLQTADRQQLAGFLARTVQDRLKRVQLHQYAPLAGDWLLRTGKVDRLFDLALAEARQFAAKDSLRQDIYRFLQQTARQAAGESTWGRLLGSFLQTFDFINLDEAADALHLRLNTGLKELEQPEHPLRLWLNERLLQSLRELEANPEWQQTLDQWKCGVIERVPFEDLLQPLLDRILGSLIQAAEKGRDARQPEEARADSTFAGYGKCAPAGLTTQIGLSRQPALLRFADRYWEAFCQDTRLQEWLERHLQDAAAEVVLSEHRVIGELVEQALRALSDRELNAFIESKVGEDLAWIRINGSVVGAVAGLAVFLFAHYLYLPYIWPWIYSIR